LELEEPIKDFGITKVTDYDRKVYGVEAIDIDINPVYAGKEGQVIEAENEDEL
jgi:hypothetical protein